MFLPRNAIVTLGWERRYSIYILFLHIFCGRFGRFLSSNGQYRLKRRFINVALIKSLLHQIM